MGYLVSNDPHGVRFNVDGVMYRSLDSHNPQTSLGLIAVAPLVVSPPAQKRNTLQIPGKNGQIDLSTVLTGFPVYENRTGQWNFIVDNNSPTDQNPLNWAAKFSRIMDILHGKEVKVYLDDDPGYFYKGNIQVEQWQPTHPWASITLSYDFEPYKYSIDEMSAEFVLGNGGGSSVSVTIKKKDSTGHDVFSTTFSPTRDNQYWVSLSRVTITSGGTSTTHELLETMPVIPESTLIPVTGDDYYIPCSLRNDKLGYAKIRTDGTGGLLFTSTSTTHNPYGLQSFVMTPNADIQGRPPGLGIRFDDVQGNEEGTLKLEWRNGRL